MTGQVLAGRYRLERQLGQGGMGSVWLAEHLGLRSWVAVKLMDPAIAATSEGADRFRREAQAAASLRSAHVVQVLDYGVDGTTPFLVMELLQGESLAHCLQRERRLSAERTLAIVTQVARAIGRAHAANIVHRDLKPDNIFLVREDDQELVKVLDFGIAKTSEPAFGGLQTRTGVTMGTPYYMSPEQAEGKRDTDHRTDLWALSVIVCECMTGMRPFNGETWGELLLNICARPIVVPSTQGPVPASFDAWFARATNRDPARRFGSAQELAQALAEVVAGSWAAGAGSSAALIARETVMMGSSQAVAAITAAGRPVTQTTSRAIEVGTTPGIPVSHAARTALLVIGGVVLGGGAVAFALFGRGERAPSMVASSDIPSAAAPVALSPPAVLPASERAVPSAPLAGQKHEATAAIPKPPAPNVVTAPVIPELQLPRLDTLAKPDARPKSEPTPQPAANTQARPAGATARCYADPFTGAIRLAGTGPRAAQAQTFACTQNPFTGKYNKL